MKATRRHELKENDLAHALGVAWEYVVENGTRIGLVVAAAVVVVAAVTLTLRSHQAALEDAWRDKRELVYGEPTDPAWDVGQAKDSLRRLGRLVEEAKDEAFVVTGLVEQGMQALRFAEAVDEPPDAEFNEIARGAFNKLLERFPDNPLAMGTAYSGLATVEENAFVLDGDESHKERARAHLRAIIDNAELSVMPYGRMALDRTKKLDETFTQVTFAEAPATPEQTSPISVTTKPGTPTITGPEGMKIERMPGPPPDLENLVPITPGAPELPKSKKEEATPDQPEEDAGTEATDEPGDEQADTGTSDGPKSGPAPESGGEAG